MTHITKMNQRRPEETLFMRRYPWQVPCYRSVLAWYQRMEVTIQWIEWLIAQPSIDTNCGRKLRTYQCETQFDWLGVVIHNDDRRFNSGFQLLPDYSEFFGNGCLPGCLKVIQTAQTPQNVEQKSRFLGINVADCDQAKP